MRIGQNRSNIGCIGRIVAIGVQGVRPCETQGLFILKPIAVKGPEVAVSATLRATPTPLIVPRLIFYQGRGGFKVEAIIDQIGRRIVHRFGQLRGRLEHFPDGCRVDHWDPRGGTTRNPARIPPIRAHTRGKDCPGGDSCGEYGDRQHANTLCDTYANP